MRHFFSETTIDLLHFVLVLFLLHVPHNKAFKHNTCDRKIRPQFQFGDCYLPPLDTSISFSSVSFLMSHGSATGYTKRASINPAGLTWRYSKNQVGSVYQQLDDGARALDIRPKLLANNTVIFHHGDINIPVPFESVIADAVQWCSENDDELVLLLPSNFAYQQTATTGTNNDDYYGQHKDPVIVSVMADTYKTYGIPYYHCTEVYGLSIAEIMKISALPTGGYLLALDGQDYYGTSCAKPNWIEDRLVTCYPTFQNTTVPCTGRRTEPMDALKQYMLASANNERNDNIYALGPPANLYNYPLNEIQAFWQVTTASAVAGLARFSSILDDNKKSNINRGVVHMVHEGQFDVISLLAVDNIALNGNAILSVLRTSCGQSDIAACGKDLAMPKMTYLGVSNIGYALLIIVYVLVLLWIGVTVIVAIRDGIRSPHPKLLWTAFHRIKEYLERRSNHESAEKSTSHKEGLLSSAVSSKRPSKI